MGENTTIDSLQIEIQSNSTNAARGIDSLAASLEKLKKSGSFKTVSTNLNHLSNALSGLPNVHNASNSLRTLANSIEKLKSVGTVSSLVNSLNKLPGALKSLESINLGNAENNVRGLVDAISPLTQVKNSGFSSMVNSMGKLKSVTESLDTETLDKFAEKVKRLNEIVEPFATKMGTIKTALSGINTQIKQTNVSIDKVNEEVNVSIFNISNMMNVLSQVHGALQQIVQTTAEIIHQATEWDGIAARFGRGFGSEAQETYEWVKRLNEEMGINIQQFMQYSSVYATMLTGFGVAHQDATKMALGYTELTYDIWAGYNDIYQTFDEAAEAVRSAIAGEVEPVRRAGFTIIESTLQQTAANHGLEVSIENATEAQKSYLRYLTLVDQAHAQGLVGTYAKEMNTAEGLLRTLSQQFKSLTQAIGSLFIPILVKALPWVQAFVELLTEAVYWLAGLAGIDIQPVDWSDYNSGVSDAVDNTENVAGALDDATKAAKELKNASIGIDELNVISPASANGSGGGTGSGTGGNGFTDLDVDSLWDESIFKTIDSQIDEIKEKLKEWMPIIGAITAGIAAWSLASFISSAGEAMVKISELEGKLGMLKKTLAGLAILTIEAVLVFALSDEYLESGNLMALLGEALATAAGGYLMYKGFGTKGLVMSLAVSIAAQLAAITMNLADGGVELSDPQLWIQSAFTAGLGGATGGILAYKGIINMSKGKGIGLGLLAGVSLSLAAITIGEVTANGELTAESIFTGIGSVLAAAGFGFVIGGPWGAAIGAVVGLTINIVGAVIGAVSKNAEKSLKEDLESRFGNITLDKESLEVYIDKITAIPREVTIDQKVWNEEIGKYETNTLTVSVGAALDVYISESKVLESLEESVYNALEKLDTLNIKIAVGVDVTESEYKSQIDAFVQNAQDYLEQYYLTTSIAINILNSDSSNKLSNVLDSFYASSSDKLADLGSKLKDTVSDAFVDGEWIPDKLQEAVELQQEIQEILDYVSNVEYRATMENLKLSISGDVLTPESFNNVLSGAADAIEERLNALEEVKMSQLQVAVMEYDANIADGLSEAEAKKIYDATVADIEEAYQNGRVEITYGTVDFGLETLKEAFAEEMAVAEAEGWFDYKSTVDHIVNLPGLTVDIGDDGNGEIYKGFKELMSNLEINYQFHAAKLSDEARKNLEELLDAMTPTMADYEELAAASRKAGETVPEEIRAGLNDYNELAALSGDVDAINYLIGQGFSTDTTFLNTLATVKNAGKQIDTSVAEGLLNNLTYVTDEATGLVTGIKNSVTGEVIAVTPTLKENMKQMGVDLSTGLAEGIEADKPSLWERFKNWCGGIVSKVKEFFGIHSPSKVFMEIGGNLSDGLSNGMGSNAIKDKLSTMWTNAKNWWKDKRGTLSTYTPSIGKIWEKLKSAWTTAKDWWKEKRSSLSYTPSIGSIKDKVSSAWTSAKNWWNKSRSSLSYTPSIGSIKDKVVSAWNSAKSWWNKNVGGLSTKLNISVPKLTVNWGEVSALGKTFKYPKSFSVKFAAEGGIFDQGSLIWAGERGPEVMATAAGGKTGVMNVEQMQEAVYEGVYSAVVAAMRGTSGNGGSRPVQVLLPDGRVLASSVEKAQHERGASIMGNEVYSY